MKATARNHAIHISAWPEGVSPRPLMACAEMAGSGIILEGEALRALLQEMNDAEFALLETQAKIGNLRQSVQQIARASRYNCALAISCFFLAILVMLT